MKRILSLILALMLVLGCFSALGESFASDYAAMNDAAASVLVLTLYDENDKEHFGLGLYICWLLSRKAGGGLTVGNVENGGGKATAVFSKNISENR